MGQMRINKPINNTKYEDFGGELKDIVTQYGAVLQRVTEKIGLYTSVAHIKGLRTLPDWQDDDSDTSLLCGKYYGINVFIDMSLPASECEFRPMPIYRNNKKGD
jgi:hypothetical protein